MGLANQLTAAAPIIEMSTKPLKRISRVGTAVRGSPLLVINMQVCGRV